jgi:hypothetical protein
MSLALSAVLLAGNLAAWAPQAAAKQPPRAVSLEEAMLDPGEEPELDEFEQAFFQVFKQTSTQRIEYLIKYSPEFAKMIHENKWGIETPELLSLLQYTGNGYSFLNQVLRLGKKDPLTEEARILAWYIFKALKKLPLKKGEVYRGMHLSPRLNKAYQVGNFVQPRGFTSTSEKAGIAYSFGGGGTEMEPGYALVKINSVSGRVLGPLTFADGEEEVLFPPGALFKVIRRKEGNFEWKAPSLSGKRQVTRKIEKGIMIELQEISDHNRIDSPIIQVQVDGEPRHERSLASPKVLQKPALLEIFKRWQAEDAAGLIVSVPKR